MLGDEIYRLIHVIFNGDNFAQWSQDMRSYLKGRFGPHNYFLGLEVSFSAYGYYLS